MKILLDDSLSTRTKIQKEDLMENFTKGRDYTKLMLFQIERLFIFCNISLICVV